jgi:heme A synthase
MSGVWTMSAVTFTVSVLGVVAVLLRLPPGRNYSRWLRLSFILLGASIAVTSSLTLFGVRDSLASALSLAAMALAIAAIVCMYRVKRTRT